MNTERLCSDSALVIVDVQNGFCPGGALPVPEGDAVVQPLSEAAKIMSECGGLVIASRDWHPRHTTHFKDGGGIWPVHCVQGTKSAQFHKDLVLPDTTIVVSKGMGKTEDAYSAFEGRTHTRQMLDDVLRIQGVRRLFAGGLATDYCVKATLLDAVKLGYDSYLLSDASKGVDIQPGDCLRAIDEMKERGVKVIEVYDMEQLLVADRIVRSCID